MGILFGKTHNNTVDEPLMEGYGVEIGGGYLAVQESYQDQLSLVQAVYEMDSAELQFKQGILTESEFESVYEAAGKNFFAKAKQFLDNLLKKIRAFFHSVIQRLQLMFGNTKKFVEKYEKELGELKLAGFKYKLYKYENLEAAVDEIKAGVTPIKDHLQKAEGDVLKALDRSSQETLQGATKAINDVDEFTTKFLNEKYNVDTVEELNNALYSELRSGAKGAEDKVEQDVNIANVISVLKDSPALIKKLDDAMKAVTDAVKEAQGRLSKLEGKISSSSSKASTGEKFDAGSYKTDSGIQHTVSLTRGGEQKAIEYVRAQSKALGIMNGFSNAVINTTRAAVEERNSEYKKVLSAALRYKQKKD